MEKHKENGNTTTHQASEKQRKYLRYLAGQAGRQIDIEGLDSRAASALIDELRAGTGQSPRPRTGGNLDARKTAFGLVTKMIAMKSLHLDKDREQFWREVHTFYTEYLEQQEAALAGSPG